MTAGVLPPGQKHLFEGIVLTLIPTTRRSLPSLGGGGMRVESLGAGRRGLLREPACDARCVASTGRMTAFETETVESRRSLGMVLANLLRPVLLQTIGGGFAACNEDHAE